MIKTTAEAKRLLAKKAQKGEFNSIVSESLKETYDNLDEEEQELLQSIALEMSKEVKGQFGLISALEVMTLLTYFEEL